MSDLQPYYQKQTTPLTAGARFIRGFKRIGLALGALVFLGGASITVFIASDQQQSAQRRFQQATCIADLVRSRKPFKMKSYDQTKIDYDDSGCPGYSFYGESKEKIISYAQAGPPASLEYAIQPFFIGIAISAACAFVSFFACWLIGWLCAGFTRD